MPEQLALLLLCDEAADRQAAADTAASARAELGPDVPVLALAGAPPPPDGVAQVRCAAEILATYDILAFARPGDRWKPGALAARLRPLASRPDVRLGVASHELVDDGGAVVATVSAPFPPLDPVAMLLRPSIEPSAVLLRTAGLPEGALDLLTLPHGDVVLWSRVTADHGLLPTGEVAAAVPLRAGRHAVDAERATTALVTALSGAEGDGPGAEVLRRELLRRLYLDDAGDRPPVDLADLLGGDPQRAARVVADLQWALERQREALRAERLGWADGRVDAADAIGQDGPDVLAAQHEIHWLHREVALRDRQIAMLHAEVQLRDAQLAARPDPAEARA